ncbi:GGDEF domain-containing protein [Pseudoxanthomonas sp.]|uniref:GGDEF domain-containing protein n=1 Tax=Pseudoxanthomonas sp. TaxID=1871049 RepID=UPI0026275322|nr:GGDEF domain-containing protein [Pseudoxanthomonas sp.]WDS34726.1 MAG: GGDEF domain-containing protein [Pseudoxanthomonas sp.]
MDSTLYLEHVRAMLRRSTTSLQVVAIIAWVTSLVVNPEVDVASVPMTWVMLLMLVGICVWKGVTASVHRWRVGTIIYGILLAVAFRMELSMMRSQGDLLTLPTAILMSVGFAGVVALRRDYLLLVVLIWAIFLLGQPHAIPPSLNVKLAAIMVVTSCLVSLGLNHAVVLSLRTTFRLKEEFRLLSETDALTGLPNRRALLAQLEFACVQSTRSASYFAMLDLDDFKAINERHGHEGGDEVLKALAQELRKLPDLVAKGRLGGEEFGMIALGQDSAAMRLILEGLLAEVRALDVHGARFGFSAGFARIQPGDRAVDVMRRADAALYAAKRRGKGRVVESAPV